MTMAMTTKKRNSTISKNPTYRSGDIFEEKLFAHHNPATHLFIKAIFNSRTLLDGQNL
jgi:hypothetical protein